MAATNNLSHKANDIKNLTAYGSINACSTTTTTTETTTAVARAATVALKFKSSAGSVCIPIESSEWTPLLSATDDACTQHGSSTKIHQQHNHDGGCLEKQTEASTGSGDSHTTRPKEVPSCFSFRTLAFLTLISTGITLGTYLLYRDSQTYKISYRLSLVQHEIWSELPLPLDALLNHTLVHTVVITQTGGEACRQPATCLRLLRQMQRNHNESSELRYNFLIGNDGQTYEARGWDYESGYAELPQATTLVIGLLGNYTKTSPGVRQLKSTFSLIWESLKRKKLLASYRIYALRNKTESPLAGERLFKELMHLPQFMGFLQTA